MAKKKSKIKTDPDRSDGAIGAISILGEALLAEFQKKVNDDDALETYAHELRERVQYRERNFLTHFKRGYQILLAELHKQVK